VPPTEELTMTTYGSPAPRRQGTRPGRVIAIVAAVFLLLIGAALAIGGGALMAVFGTDGEASTAKAPVTTSTAAVVTDITEIRNTNDVADALGTPITSFAADGGNASGLFVGIGPASDVDRFLSGVAIDQVVDLSVDPYSLDLSRRDGPQTTASPPADQKFWVASASGTTGLDLSWQVQDGDYRVVLMNVDGAAGVQSQLGIGLGLSGMFGLALGLLIGGAVLIVLAIALLVFTRPRLAPPAYPGGYPPAGNGPPRAGAGAAPQTGYGPPAGNGPPSGAAPQAGYGPPAGNEPSRHGAAPAGYAPPAGYPPPTPNPLAPHSPPTGFPLPAQSPPPGNPAGYVPPAGPLPPAEPTPPVREPLP
jgi:hypothetical protein